MSREQAYDVDEASEGFPPTCPSCGDIAFPGASICDGCGSALFIRAGSGRPFVRQIPVGCSCGGNSICVACCLAEYEGELPR